MFSDLSTRKAALQGHLECLKFLISNDCQFSYTAGIYYIFYIILLFLFVYYSF